MSDRLTKISRLKAYRTAREAYIKGKLSVLIPAQIRALRLKSKTPKQQDMAKEAGMKQSRISAAEKPGAVNFNLDTLVRIASALKVGLIVEFVPFGTMLAWENGFSQDRFNVVTLDEDTEFIRSEKSGQVSSREDEQKFMAMLQSGAEFPSGSSALGRICQCQPASESSALGSICQQLNLDRLPPNVLRMPERIPASSTSAIIACAMEG